MSAQTPPGWYPDPSGQPGVRWWDGGAWTEHAQPGQVPCRRPQLPHGVPTNTAFIWVLALLPLLGLPFGFVYSPSFHFVTVGPAHLREIDPSSISTPAYFATQALGLAFYAASIVLAWLDARTLARRGVARPFPWPWAFLGAEVYVIGRFVVIRKVAPAASRAPLWGYVVLLGASLVVSGIRVAAQLQGMF